MHGENPCFLKLDLVRKLGVTEGKSMMDESPLLKVSSSVLWDAASSSSKTVLGEEFLLLLSETFSFCLREIALSLLMLLSVSLELGCPVSAIRNRFRTHWCVLKLVLIVFKNVSTRLLRHENKNSLQTVFV